MWRIYTLDYRDRFLFLMLETFFLPENVGNFHNRSQPAFFLWWKAEQYNQENRKKSIMVMSSFLSTLLFSTFILMCSLFFHPCKRVPSEHTWEHFTGRSHITRSSKRLFFSPINIKNKRTKFNPLFEPLILPYIK
jgi:hypothetical protein